MADVVFPEGFRFGANVSAHQFEGYGKPENFTENDWTEYEKEHPDHIWDRSNASVACDSYLRYREDLKLARDLGLTAFRFNVEWSRVEPQPGVYDQAALDHYTDMARCCRELGMEPIVTLQHFTLPLWLAKKGGLLAQDAPEHFAAYTAKVVGAMGADVRYWLTVNEPNVLAGASYYSGEFPPLGRSLWDAIKASLQLTRMHAAAATVIREQAGRNGWPAEVSFADHKRPMYPRRWWNPLDHLATMLPDYLFNKMIPNACATGVFGPRILAPFLPKIKGGRLDYGAINYYAGQVLQFDPASWQAFFIKDGGPRNDPQTGNEIPITNVVRTHFRRYKLPIMITENGTTDPDAGRSTMLVRNLVGIHRSMNPESEPMGPVKSFLKQIGIRCVVHKAVKVLAYAHWALIDDWEWNSGYLAKMGLYAMNPENQDRIPKPSAELYGGIATTRTITQKQQHEAGLGTA